MRQHLDDAAIIFVASPLSISVHDHIIVSKDGHASLKRLKLVYQSVTRGRQLC
jgi:DNA repair protein RadC